MFKQEKKKTVYTSPSVPASHVHPEVPKLYHNLLNSAFENFG